MVIFTRVHNFTLEVHGQRDEGGQSNIARAALLLETFCSDRCGNTKCLKLIKHFAISQLIIFLKYTPLLIKALVHLPPVLLSLEPGWEVEMTHDYINDKTLGMVTTDDSCSEQDKQIKV